MHRTNIGGEIIDSGINTPTTAHLFLFLYLDILLMDSSLFPFAVVIVALSEAPATCRAAHPQGRSPPPP